MFHRSLSNPIPLAALLLLALTGCSPFHQAWRQAGDQPGPGITGRWEGTWESTASGHTGRLRCVIEPLERDPDHTHLARYHAVYAGILTFSYDVPMRTRQEGDATRFEGHADLGKLAGGVYHYTGRIQQPEDPTQASFTAEYHADADHGVFKLHR